MGFLGVRFEVGEVKIRPPPCLTSVRIMIETSNLARKYTAICNFRKKILGFLNFADITIFLQKLAFFIQKRTFTQSNSVRAMLEIF